MKPPAEGDGFSVLVFDMAHAGEWGAERLVRGFASLEAARAYAEARIRASVEELRRPRQSAQELRSLWHLYGEDCRVLGDSRSPTDIDLYIAVPATPEQIDWPALLANSPAFTKMRDGTEERQMDANDFLPDEGTVRSLRGDIARYEERRIAVRRGILWRAPLFMGLVVVIMLLLAWGFNGIADANEQWTSAPHVFLYVAGLVGLVLAWMAANAPARRMQQRFREDLLPTVFSFIDGLRYAKGHIPGSFERLPREAAGSFNREHFDDVISGSHAGFGFELFETKLSQKAGKTETTSFRGVVTAFELETPFPGILVATRKSNQVMSFFKGLFGGSGLQEVQSGVPALDETYDFRTDNVDAALPLVRGHVAQALQWLADAWPEEPARIALKGSDGFLLLPTSKDFFELPPISVPLDYDRHIKPIVADMASLLATAALVRKVGSSPAASG